MRLDKFLSNMLPYSRKEVTDFIKKGHVTVNDDLERCQDSKIDPEVDVIKLNGQAVCYHEFIYLMLNKPAGYVSATEDLKCKTVLDLVPEEFRHYDLFPVGRLDRDTEGLLILTNDGKLAHELLSPKKHVNKVYYAKVNCEVTEADVETFSQGVTLEDGYHTMPGQLVVLKNSGMSEILLTIKEGKFHQVKRMFEAVGKQVTYLKRVRMGNILLDETLPLGSMRPLCEREVQMLRERGDHDE